MKKKELEKLAAAESLNIIPKVSLLR